MKLKNELLIDKLIEGFNQEMIKNESSTRYSISINERERTVTFLNDKEKETDKDTFSERKQYYGTALLLMHNEEEEYPILLWRTEYVFYNLTKKQKDYTWKERLCEGLLYEALGVFVAVVHHQYETDAKDSKASLYDVKLDEYVPINKPVEKCEPVKDK